jgi:tRNA modification GTPase
VLKDTIIAIATPPGFGGLGIVRLSGPRAAAVAGKLFEAKGGSKGRFPDRRAIFGWVLDPGTGRPLDEGFLTYFKAPRSYTGEDVVEISAHGSPAVLEGLMTLGTRAGARLARPGEFTLRAYLNGRLDMLQAQAVNDLVRSVSLAQARVSARQVGGSLSKRIGDLRARIIALLSRIEAGLEFPEDGLRAGHSAGLKAMDRLIGDIGRLVSSYEAGRALAEGITLAIVGRTNVGKSTLFNALLEEDRAIVTPFPGTTRDFLSEKLVLDGMVFHLVDMAGFGRASHPIENRGIVKGRKIAGTADGLLLVLDASRRASEDDGRLIRRYQGKKAIVVLNKTDLPRRVSARRVKAMAGALPVVEISALKGRHLDDLRGIMRAAFAPAAGRDEEVLLHGRQKDCLQAAHEALERARELLAEGHSEELCAEEIRSALRLVADLTGEVRTEEVLEDIFSRFCVGK